MIEIKTKLMYSKDAVPYNINKKDVRFIDGKVLLRTEGLASLQLGGNLEKVVNGSIQEWDCDRPDVQWNYLAKRVCWGPCLRRKVNK